MTDDGLRARGIAKMHEVYQFSVDPELVPGDFVALTVDHLFGTIWTRPGLEVPEARGRWVDPGEEYNKIGYYRVFGSRLRYELDGDAHAFDVKSLISWRGEWYVVHLSAIK